MEKYKNFWRRLVAAFVDEIILFPLSYIAAYLENRDHQFFFIVWSIFYTLAYVLYFVWLHGRYGQTIGKKVMGIKIVTLDEGNVIGLMSAFKREAVWITASVTGLLFFLISNGSTNMLDDFVGAIALIWFALEMITMLFNKKRRAIHDFIAGSVVIKH